MSFILNLLWLFFGGFTSALAWLFASLILILTIIGIPWARSTFNIGILVLWPFGSKAISREFVTGEDIGTGSLGFLGNIIWFVFVGWWLFLYHLGLSVLFCITIIGIPFGIQYLKIAKISLAPIGRKVIWS